MGDRAEGIEECEKQECKEQERWDTQKKCDEEEIKQAKKDKAMQKVHDKVAAAAHVTKYEVMVKAMVPAGKSIRVGSGLDWVSFRGFILSVCVGTSASNEN